MSPPCGWRLRINVPEEAFTLAVEADDKAAQAEHAAFATRCLPLFAADGCTDEARLRQEIISQLGAMRQSVAASGLGYLGALAGVKDNRPVLLLLGIAGTPLAMPDGISPSNLLTALLRYRYPAAQIEEFPTAQGEAVGIRRYGELPFPYTASHDELVTIGTGISQALVPFPEAGLLGTVTGLCCTREDIDLATVFTTTIAYRMSVIPQPAATPGLQNPL
jgi:hypothetical protein